MLKNIYMSSSLHYSGIRFYANPAVTVIDKDLFSLKALFFYSFDPQTTYFTDFNGRQNPFPGYCCCSSFCCYARYAEERVRIQKQKEVIIYLSISEVIERSLLSNVRLQEKLMKKAEFQLL